MTHMQAKALSPGVYRLVMRHGDDTFAIVGIGLKGQRWYATPDGCEPWNFEPPLGRKGWRRYKAGRTDWRRVARAVPVLCVDVEGA